MSVMGDKQNVLFVCSHNSARSQMAHGWLDRLAGDRFEVASAGVEPGVLNPLTVRVMGEVGIDLSTHMARDIKEYLGRWKVDFLIIVCDKASQTCPRIWPGVGERLEWSFDDPSAAQGSEEQRLEVFRRVRDEIRETVEQWIESRADSSPQAASKRGERP